MPKRHETSYRSILIVLAQFFQKKRQDAYQYFAVLFLVPAKINNILDLAHEMNRNYKINIGCILSACFLDIGCSVQHDIFREAESCLEKNPELTVHLLDSIPTESVNGKKNKAYYALLYSMALDKSYIDMTTDSLLSPAIRYYYQRKGTSRNKMLTMYYHGRVMFNAGNFAQAAVRFAKAERLAADLKDTLYLGLIFMAKADTYNNQYNSEEEVKAVETASYYFNALNIESRKTVAEYRLAAAYQNSGHYDLADSLYIVAAGRALASNDTMLYHECMKGYAGLNVFEGDPIKSLNTYNDLLKADVFMDTRDIGKMACAYALTGYHDIARELISRLEQSEDSHYYNYVIQKAAGNHELAFEELEATLRVLKNTLEKIMLESAIKAERDHYQMEYMDSELKGLRIKTILLLILLCLFSSIAVILSIVRYYLRMKEENIQLVSSLDRAMTENEKLVALRSKSIRLFKSQFHILRDLCETNTFYAGRKDKSRKIMAVVKDILSRVNSTNGGPSELEKIIDKELEGAMSTLRTEMPKLKQQDFTAITYFIAGFDAVLISRLMDVDQAKVHMMKFRLAARIKQTAEKKDHDTLREIATYIKS